MYSLLTVTTSWFHESIKEYPGGRATGVQLEIDSDVGGIGRLVTCEADGH